jgi:hypothetical protein
MTIIRPYSGGPFSGSTATQESRQGGESKLVSIFAHVVWWEETRELPIIYSVG